MRTEVPEITNIPSAPEPAGGKDSASLELEQLLAKVTAGGVAPLLTKQVLDKLLEAAIAANMIQQPIQIKSPTKNSQQQHSSLPDLMNQVSQPMTQEHHSVTNGGASGDDDEESPTESISPVTEGGTPRKSNLMTGRSKNNGSEARQLSVRFDPNQVNNKTTSLCIVVIYHLYFSLRCRRMMVQILEVEVRMQATVAAALVAEAVAVVTVASNAIINHRLVCQSLRRMVIGGETNSSKCNHNNNKIRLSHGLNPTRAEVVLI